MSNKQQDYDMKSVGLHLRRARIRYGVGLREFARDLGVSAAYVTRVETGLETASERVLKTYCDRFRISFDELSRALGRVPSDVSRHLIETPGAIQKVRMDMVG